MSALLLVVAVFLFAFLWRQERLILRFVIISFSDKDLDDTPLNKNTSLNKSEINTSDANVRIYTQLSLSVQTSDVDLDNPEAEREANETAKPRPKLIRLLGFVLFIVAALFVGSYFVLERLNEVPITPVVTIEGASVIRGQQLIRDYGCGACHVIPGVKGAVSHAGPNLQNYGNRSYVAGYYSNTPDVLIRWLQNPQQLRPGSAMPNLGLNATEARDMAAYLYQLR